MSDALTAIDAMIERIRALPRALTVEAAPAIADIIRDDLARTTAAGASPNGTSWEPRKADGGRPLVNADAHVFVAAVGGTIFVRLKGVEARHHRGRVKGGVKREIIYTSGQLPTRVVTEVEALIAKRFQAHMKGEGQ